MNKCSATLWFYKTFLTLNSPSVFVSLRLSALYCFIDNGGYTNATPKTDTSKKKLFTVL